MKKFIIATIPFVLLIWLLFWIEKGFVYATIAMLVIIVFVVLAICWLIFVENHFND